MNFEEHASSQLPSLSRYFLTCSEVRHALVASNYLWAFSTSALPAFLIHSPMESASQGGPPDSQSPKRRNQDTRSYPLCNGVDV